ncbi:endonuclease-reverse transcriptase [Trichonephila clavipes]|nr:endonuclease-reverse transcriptase [Trichonephila clavipes]
MEQHEGLLATVLVILSLLSDENDTCVLYKEPQVTQVIRSNRLRWLGHIWRSPENNQTRAYTFKNPMGSRTRGRPPTRWIDDLENDLKTLNIKNCQRVLRIVRIGGSELWRQPRPVTGVGSQRKFLSPVRCPVTAFQKRTRLSSNLFLLWFGNSSNDHQARRRFIEWAQNEIAVVPDFHKRILFSDEAHFWLNGYVNKQNCRIWSEANPQVYVETPLHPEKLTVWCALWAGGILLQKR